MINAITSWISNMIGSLIGGGVRQGGEILGREVGKKMKGPEPWEKIKVDDEEKKFTFQKGAEGHYYLFYDAKELGYISTYDLKSFTSKTKDAAIYHLIYKLETMHKYFKNRELAKRFAEKLYTEITR